jgi:hypothetical protein
MSTAREIYRFAKRDRYARPILAAVWLVAFIVTAGLAQLHVELAQHPLVEVAR